MDPVSLAVREFGSPDAAPIAAPHGGLGTGVQRQRMGSEALPDRRWVCPDLRGHGDSPAGSSWSLEQFDETVGLVQEFLSEEDAQ